MFTWQAVAGIVAATAAVTAVVSNLAKVIEFLRDWRGGLKATARTVPFAMPTVALDRLGIMDEVLSHAGTVPEGVRARLFSDDNPMTVGEAIAAMPPSSHLVFHHIHSYTKLTITNRHSRELENVHFSLDLPRFVEIDRPGQPVELISYEERRDRAGVRVDLGVMRSDETINVRIWGVTLVSSRPIVRLAHRGGRGKLQEYRAVLGILAWCDAHRIGIASYSAGALVAGATLLWFYFREFLTT